MLWLSERTFQDPESEKQSTMRRSQLFFEKHLKRFVAKIPDSWEHSSTIAAMSKFEIVTTHMTHKNFYSCLLQCNTALSGHSRIPIPRNNPRCGANLFIELKRFEATIPVHSSTNRHKSSRRKWRMKTFILATLTIQYYRSNRAVLDPESKIRRNNHWFKLTTMRRKFIYWKTFKKRRGQDSRFPRTFNDSSTNRHDAYDA